MKKFFHLNKLNDQKSTVLLNFDYIFKIELSPIESQGALSRVQSQRFHINCISDDGIVLACLDFDTIEEAHHWVLENLEIQL
jgi:hypothetical protein